jgi:hypothetical protein
MKWTLSERGTDLSSNVVEWSRSPWNLDLREVALDRSGRVQPLDPTQNGQHGLDRRSLANRLTIELRKAFASDSGIALMDSVTLEHGVYRALTALAQDPTASAQLDLFGGTR